MVVARGVDKFEAGSPKPEVEADVVQIGKVNVAIHAQVRIARFQEIVLEMQA